jgi:hypothetical protein
MGVEQQHLSGRAIAILEMIAAGSSYDQILLADRELTYYDIFDAAREALDLSVTGSPRKNPAYGVEAVRVEHPRAYTPWTENDDAELRDMVRGGLTVAQIANRLQRQRSAIRSRISKLDLVGDLSEHEQAELRRISALDPKE